MTPWKQLFPDQRPGLNLALLPSWMCYGHCLLSFGIRELDIVYFDRERIPRDEDIVTILAGEGYRTRMGPKAVKQLKAMNGKPGMVCDADGGHRFAADGTLLSVRRCWRPLDPDDVIAGVVVARLRYTVD